MSYNIAKAVQYFLNDIEEFGFGDICMDFERECIWHKEYAIFVYDIVDENPYFDEESFIEEFIQDLKKTLPEGSQVIIYYLCNEIEVLGPNHDEFYKKHMDKLEEMCIKHDGHHSIYMGEANG